MKRLALLALLAGCGGSSGPDMKKLLGTEVKPPYGLDQLRRGMTLIEAENVAGLREVLEPGVEQLTKDTGDKDVEIEVHLGGGRVASIELVLHALHDVGPVEAAWGPPTRVEHTAVAKSDLVYWIDADTGWEAKLHCFGSLPCRLTYVPHKPLDAAALGAAPSIPAWVGPVRFFMTKDELTAATITERGIPTEYTGVGRDLDLDGRGQVIAIGVGIQGDVTGLLETAWGPGVEVRDRMLWWNPAAGVRATRELRKDSMQSKEPDVTVLLYEPYMPIATFLGDGDDFAFAGGPLVGRPVADLEQIAAAIPGAHLAGLKIDLPLFEHEARAMYRPLQFEELDGKLVTARFSIHDDLTILDLLKRKWPTSTPDPAYPGRLILREAGPRITATTTNEIVELLVEDK